MTNAPNPLDHTDEPMKIFPPITQQMVDAFVLTYPRLYPVPGTTTQEHIWYDAGVQRVVKKLQEVKDWQENDQE